LNQTVNIIGAGLAGSITAALLRREGFEARVIDDGDSKAGSNASSNLYIASWLKKFSSAEAANGINIIESLYGEKVDQPFFGGIAAAGKVKHIAQRHILVEPDVKGTVIMVDSDGVSVACGPMKESKFFKGLTIVCAGYRHNELVKGGPEVWVKAGHCFLFDGTLSEGASRLAIVSPYRHEKLYQFAPGLIYYADSVALKLKDFLKRQQEMYEKTLSRAQKHIGQAPIKEYRVGYRPFVDGHDFGYAAKVCPNVWAVNGGGKNGLVAYANCASKLVAELKAA
jgi:glycine/D-amino acid oxidase-like deaminating enzyme